MAPPVNESAASLVLATGATLQTELAARDALDGRRKGVRAFLPVAAAVVKRTDLAMPPSITTGMAKGFTLHMVR